MTAAALAICGAAWLGGIALLASVGSLRVTWPRSVAVDVPLAAIGAIAAVAAAPLLLLVAPVEPSAAPWGVGGVGGVGAVGAIVGLAAALVGGWIVASATVAPDRTVAPHRTVVRAEPVAGLRGLAPALASAAAGIAIAVGLGGTLDVVVGAGGSRIVAVAAGGALVTAAIPSMLYGAGRARRESLAVAVAGASLAGAGLATAPPFLGAAGSVLAVLALASGASFASSALNRRGAVVTAVAAIAVPVVVGAVSIALLWTEGTRPAAAMPTQGGHAALVLATVGALGAGLLALGERSLHPRRSPLPLLAAAAAVPVAAVALGVGDAITACLIAAAAAVVVTTIRPTDADPAPEQAIIVGGAIFATLGLAAVAFALRTPDASASGVGLAGLVLAAAVALRFGAIPFHRSTIAMTDRMQAAVAGLASGWLPAVFAFAALGGLAGATVSAPRPLDAAETALVVVVAVVTILLGAIASLVQERLVHAIAYLVAAQSGWAVLATVAPSASWPAASGWLAAFAAASLTLGGVLLLADRGTGTTRVGDLGRSPTEGSIEVLALAGAGLALIGLPGIGTWTLRAAIGEAAFGDGLAADGLVAVGALVTVAALARLVGTAGGPLVRPNRWRLDRLGPGLGRLGPRLVPRLGRLEAVAVGSLLGAAAVALLALLAAAIGLGLVA